MSSLRILWLQAQISYFEWARREIDPLHPDLPDIVLAISRLRAQRAAL